MRNSKKLTVTTALALTMTLGLAACGGGEPDTDLPGVSAPSGGPTDARGEDQGDDADDASGDDTTGDNTSDDQGNAGATDDSAGATDDSTGDVGGELTATALAAIATAEAEAGGEAYEIDDQDDDGTWEVDVRVDDHSVEVTVSADGTEVLETEQDDLDDDDRAALDAATITLSDAIELAIAEVGGELDDAELEGPDDGLPHHWEVTVDSDAGDDIEVLISVDGEVLRTDA